MRRADDPTGTTIPDELLPQSQLDLVKLLPNRPPQFLPGAMVPGIDRQIVRCLGQGGFGEVYLACQPRFPKRSHSVLKFCLAEESTSKFVEALHNAPNCIGGWKKNSSKKTTSASSS